MNIQNQDHKWNVWRFVLSISCDVFFFLAVSNGVFYYIIVYGYPNTKDRTIVFRIDTRSPLYMDDIPVVESAKDRDEELVSRIRTRINEVEELIEAMKSKLPGNSQ